MSIPFPVDGVNIFVNFSLAGAVVDEAIGVKATAVGVELAVSDDAPFA